MTNADKMLDDLGYHVYCNDRMSLEYEKYVGGDDEYICFYKPDHEVYKQWCMECGNISMAELRAINEKCKELGWLDD